MKCTALLQVGIRENINLQEEDEKGSLGKTFVPYEPIMDKLADDSGIYVRRTRFPIRDYGLPQPQTMVSILDAIDAAVRRSRPVYVHCWGGHGRTGTVIGCWLVRHGHSGEGALCRISALREFDAHLHGQAAPQTPEQVRFVRTWGQRNRGPV